MDVQISEQAERQEAVRRRLQGERPCDICRDMGRTTRWLNKWWNRYQNNPETDFADESRRPHTSPQQIPAGVERAIVSVRTARERGRTAETRYGLIGHRAVQSDLRKLKVKPLPSMATIQRVMSRNKLTHPLGANSAAAYYPWPVAWAPNAIQATDLITRHLRGGEKIENVHTIDLYSLAMSMSQYPGKSSAIMCQHLLKTWAFLGLPLVHQTDNEALFCGGQTHPRVMGQVVRLCLFCGIEVMFTPKYDPKRNYQIETFHSVWVAGFWSRKTFRNCAQVSAEAPVFSQWYHTTYCPPSLAGHTPAQMRRGFHPFRLSQRLLHIIPHDHLPITAGRIHFMRKVDLLGQVDLLDEVWSVGTRWVGAYIRATINTAEQSLSFWHKPDAQTDWHCIKTRRFTLKECVHNLLPEFRRNSERCREQWPG